MATIEVTPVVLDNGELAILTANTYMVIPLSLIHI